jgi:hypothetical protein
VNKGGEVETVFFKSGFFSFSQPNAVIRTRQKEKNLELGRQYFIEDIKVKKNLSFEEDRFF